MVDNVNHFSRRVFRADLPELWLWWRLLKALSMACASKHATASPSAQMTF